MNFIYLSRFNSKKQINKISINFVDRSNQVEFSKNLEVAECHEIMTTTNCQVCLLCKGEHLTSKCPAWNGRCIRCGDVHQHHHKCTLRFQFQRGTCYTCGFPDGKFQGIQFHPGEWTTKGQTRKAQDCPYGEIKSYFIMSWRQGKIPGNPKTFQELNQLLWTNSASGWPRAAGIFIKMKKN